MANYNTTTGERMEVEGALKPHLDKLLKEYPKFMEGQEIVIRAKDKKKRTIKVFNGKTDETAREAGERILPPPPQYVATDGFYEANSQKFPVTYSEAVPTRDAAGKPIFNSPNISVADGMNLTMHELDKAVFLFCFSPSVDGGIMGNGSNNFEFIKPQKVAAARLEAIQNSRARILENEILIKETRMNYDDLKRVMSLMGVTPVVPEDEAIDRLNLFDKVSALPETDTRYQKATESVLKDVPKYDLSNVDALVDVALKQEVVVEKKSFWNLKKSTNSFEKIVEVKGITLDEQIFALKEHLTENPSWIETIQKYIK